MPGEKPRERYAAGDYPNQHPPAGFFDRNPALDVPPPAGHEARGHGGPSRHAG